MEALISVVVAAASRRRGVVLAAVLVVIALSIGGARRVSFDADVLSLLPRDGDVVPAFREYLSRFGNVDQLYVVFTAPPTHAVGEYAEEIDDWVDRLRHAAEIGHVDAGIADGSRNYAWLADHQLLLLDGARIDKALARLSAEGMNAAVAARRELLTLPSTQMADLVRQDPIGLTDLLAEAIGGTVPALSASVATRGYISTDGRQRLVTARPVRPPYDSAFSRALDARLRAIAAEVEAGDAARAVDRDELLPPLTVAFAGGHRIALETEAVVRRESIWNTVGSLALILPLLFVAFRSVWLVLVGPLPSGLSLLIVLGILGVTGTTLSAAAAGSAAMLFGLGIDGVVLLYVAHRQVAASGISERDHGRVLAGPSSSMLLGMWTTAATFYGLAFVDFPSLQQLGLLVGHAMVACGLLTLVLVPALFPRSASPRDRRSLTAPRLAAWVARRRSWVLVSAALITALLAVAASRVRINPTLDRLHSVTPSAQLERTLATTFGLPQDVYIALSEGSTLEPLLEADERLAARVARELPALPMQAASKLLPSQASQALAAQRIQDAQLSPEDVGANLIRVSESAGFRRDAFDAFAERLPRLLDPHRRLTFDGFETHGLGDLIRQFVVRDDGGWHVATYFFPTDERSVATLEALVRDAGPSTRLTGLPLVNRELGQRFLPQFVKGLAIGTTVVVLLVWLAFRVWRLALYALLPTIVGLIWAAGILGLARVELDLFALFAVVTFIGIGVDYGIHLVHRFQERGDAVQAVAELAPVILVAAAITLLGYGTLLNSTYPPLRSIGMVSIVSALTLSVSSVLLLPALLMTSRT